ncbi:MAG: class I SAM-dependent methyltransferase, partial [Acidimicrobiia bacterium]|nr:class I SAM-dependent methyltransferase [Acidimicrobiia bacterium]
MADRLDATRRMWSSGDYASVGDLFAGAGATLVEAVGVAGLEVLDVATGTGNTALAAARAGAKRVVGVDLTPALLAEASRRSAAAGFSVEWKEGDMEALSAPDAGFDRVLSSFGAMFASDQGAMAAELVRVCRPGGRVGLTAWALDGLFDRMTTVLVSHLPAPPPPAPSPRDWASHASLERICTGLPGRGRRGADRLRAVSVAGGRRRAPRDPGRAYPGGAGGIDGCRTLGGRSQRAGRAVQRGGDRRWRGLSPRPGLRRRRVRRHRLTPTWLPRLSDQVGQEGLHPHRPGNDHCWGDDVGDGPEVGGERRVAGEPDRRGPGPRRGGRPGGGCGRRRRPDARWPSRAGPGGRRD